MPVLSKKSHLNPNSFDTSPDGRCNREMTVDEGACGKPKRGRRLRSAPALHSARGIYGVRRQSAAATALWLTVISDCALFSSNSRDHLVGPLFL